MKLQISDKGITILFGKIIKSELLKLQIEELKKALLLKQPLILDAKETKEIDAASLQLILSFILAAKEKNIPYTWTHVSPTFNYSSNLMGLHKHLGLPD